MQNVKRKQSRHYKIKTIIMKKNSYKVEITQSQTYVFDIQANTEQEADALGYSMFDEKEKAGVLHYHEFGDASLSATSYDVTGTDDDAFINS